MYAIHHLIGLNSVGYFVDITRPSFKSPGLYGIGRIEL